MAEPKRRLISHPRQIFYAKVRTLIEKWNPEPWAGDIRIDAVKNLEHSDYPKSFGPVEGTHFYLLGDETPPSLMTTQRVQMRQVAYNGFLSQNLTSLHLLGTRVIVVLILSTAPLWES